MRSIIYDGDVKFTRNHPEPSPGKNEVLIRVHLAGICATDIEITKGYLNFQGVLGHEFVGTVVDGDPARRGQRVVSEINCVCGSCDLCTSGLSSHCRRRTVIGIQGRDGCFAEYIVVPERNVHEVPATISDEEAVFVEPLAAACQVVKQCLLEPRMKVAVVGSGKLGLLVAQVIALTGCKLEVIGRNPLSLAFCEKRMIQSIQWSDVAPHHDKDVVVECTGNPAGLGLAMQLVRPRGVVVLKSTYAGGQGCNPTPLVVDEVTVIGSRCGPFGEAINTLARRQVEVASMISRQYPLERAMEALEATEDPRNIKILFRPGG